jgi:hypothetical protein
MPIFNDEITFIHIPKCGGTSIENFLVDNNFNMSLFTSSGSVFINGHSPQHCTYNELERLNLLTDKIFAIIRPEVDRVVSEYFYILENRLDLSRLFKSFDEFLDLFLDYNNTILFDNHNLSNKEFLVNEFGVIDEKIKIFDFFNTEEIEDYLKLKGLDKIHKMQSKNKKHILENHHIEKIKKFYDS